MDIAVTTAIKMKISFFIQIVLFRNHRSAKVYAIDMPRHKAETSSHSVKLNGLSKKIHD